MKEDRPVLRFRPSLHLQLVHNEWICERFFPKEMNRSDCPAMKHIKKKKKRVAGDKQSKLNMTDAVKSHYGHLLLTTYDAR